MSKLRDAAQQALEALESAIPWIVTDRNTFAEVVRARHFQRKDTETDESILSGYDAVIDDAEKAITALRVALAEQPAEQQPQEPVAWGIFYFGGKRNGRLYSQIDTEEGAKRYISDLHRSNDTDTFRAAPLYTAPQPRKRLTREEIMDAVCDVDLDWHQGWPLDEDAPNRYETLCRAIERAHGIGEHE